MNLILAIDLKTGDQFRWPVHSSSIVRTFKLVLGILKQNSEQYTIIALNNNRIEYYSVSPAVFVYCI